MTYLPLCSNCFKSMFPQDKCICGKHQKIWYEKSKAKEYKNPKIQKMMDDKTKSLKEIKKLTKLK